MKSFKKLILILFLSFTSSQLLFSQKFANEQEEINAKIEYANNLIWHFNYNIKALSTFQEDIVIWFENPKRAIINIPTFSFVSFSGEKIQIPQSDRLKQDIFNYNFHLDRIEKKILAFNLLTQRIQNNTYKPDSELKYINDLYKMIDQIQTISNELAEIAYDFSRSCAVNYKLENKQSQIQKTKNLVSQSKNVILAMRENNKELVKEYAGMLNQALVEVDKTINIKELYLVTKTSLSLGDLNDIIDGIYNKAFNISSWSENYLQGNLDTETLTMLLQETISEFNEAEGKLGCASGFNTIVSYGKIPLMYYVEEPNIILVEKITPSIKSEEEEEEIIDIAEVYTESVEEKEDIYTDRAEEKELIEKKTVEELIIKVEEPEPEKFEAKNLNSLAGALPNNLIVLLDISVSMKKSGKLPILKNTISHFLNIMRSEDKISLITYSGETSVLISGGTKNDKQNIIDTLTKVKSSGGADIYNALKEAKKIGNDNFIQNGNNKIIIASDGIFGVTQSVLKFTEQLKVDNYSLSVFQFSKEGEEVNLTSLKGLASKGNGNYIVIYNANDAISSMMQEIKKEDKSIK